MAARRDSISVSQVNPNRKKTSAMIDLPSFRLLEKQSSSSLSGGKSSNYEPSIEDYADKGLFDFEINIAVVGDEKTGKTCLLRYEIEQLPLNEQLGDRENIGIIIRSKYYFQSMMIAHSEDDWKSQNYVVKVNYWDCTGKEAYVEETCRLVSGCIGVVYVFDLMNARTFDDIREWMSLVEGPEWKPMAANIEPDQMRFNHLLRKQLSFSSNLKGNLTRMNSILQQPTKTKLKRSKSFASTRKRVLIGTKMDIEESGPMTVRTNEIKRFSKDMGIEAFQTSAVTGRNIYSALSDIRSEICDMISELSFQQILLARQKLYPGVVIGSKFLEGLNSSRFPSVMKPLYLMTDNEKEELDITESVDWL